MQNNNISDKKLRLTIRIASGTMSFSVGDPQESGQIVHEPYQTNDAMSVAANLREAFKKSELLQSGYRRVLALIDSPIMLMPVDEFQEQEQDVETLFKYTFANESKGELVKAMLPEFNSAVVFAINKDLKLVLDDHFEDIRIMHLMQPVWGHLYRRAFSAVRRKLFAYFHEKKVDIFAFGQGRFLFSNSFGAEQASDVLYFLLNVWKQLGMDFERDELHTVGTPPEPQWLAEQLNLYVRRNYTVNVATNFNNIPMAAEKHIPYDLKALYLK